jgi:dimethylargininase
MTRIAITRPVSASIVQCELTHLAREPIDHARAVKQHAAYEAALAQHVVEIVRVPALDELPDAVFVEDAAVVFDELAVMARSGALSRRPESRGVERVLARYRDVEHIVAPGTLDGGDVLRVGKRIFVGRSSRTNDAGILQLRGLVAKFDYKLVAPSSQVGRDRGGREHAPWQRRVGPAGGVRESEMDTRGPHGAAGGQRALGG